MKPLDVTGVIWVTLAVLGFFIEILRVIISETRRYLK